MGGGVDSVSESQVAGARASAIYDGQNNSLNSYYSINQQLVW